MQRTENEIDLRITVAAALICANKNPTEMVYVDNVPNRPEEWEIVRGEANRSAFWIEEGSDFEETVALIKRVRGL